MDLAVIIPAVFAGGVVVAVATLWASFGPSTKPISALLRDTSLSRSSTEGQETPHGSPRKKKQTTDDTRPSGSTQVSLRVGRPVPRRRNNSQTEVHEFVGCVEYSVLVCFL